MICFPVCYVYALVRSVEPLEEGLHPTVMLYVRMCVFVSISQLDYDLNIEIWLKVSSPRRFDGNPVIGFLEKLLPGQGAIKANYPHSVNPQYNTQIKYTSSRTSLIGKDIVSV